MAHAISGYPGACKNIHGHSYELHVTVTVNDRNNFYIPAPGFVFDFKELKQLIKENVLKTFDHKLVLSERYIGEHPDVINNENLVNWSVEPSAENLLIYIERTIDSKLPAAIQLAELKLYETKDSYARWVNTAIHA